MKPKYMKNKVSEIKISYQSKLNISKAPQIKSSDSAAIILFDNWDLLDIELRETFNILLLNRANRVKGIVPISKGGVSGTTVDAKLVFSVALKTMSSGIILSHNHPSGNNQPSASDIALTNKLKKASEYLDIDILDHIILTPERGKYYSFSDEGLI